MTWQPHGFDSFYTLPGSNTVLANVHFSHERWVWEAHSPEDMGLDRDGWWGTEPTEKEAQEAAEAYLRKYRVPVI
jgi:hypothetical protein